MITRHRDHGTDANNFSNAELRKSTYLNIKNNCFDRRLCRTTSKGSMLRPTSDKYMDHAEISLSYSAI